MDLCGLSAAVVVRAIDIKHMDMALFQSSRKLGPNSNSRHSRNKYFFLYVYKCWLIGCL